MRVKNKPWNTEKVDFYDDFLENVLNTPWEKEIYYRQLPVATVVHNQHTELQQTVLLQTKIKRALMPYVNKYAPVGSPRRNKLTKYYYKVRRSILG
ncbi:Uncharacterised protein [Raoultella planticola]|uniref:Uncharacterized protein n=1 Tax=Raoultella planticola TaxID=575 RepID=A0A485D045_RAOPL|nr:Uncharacterised protein [Raoultella planticola]